jgi:hypothetical protein
MVAHAYDDQSLVPYPGTLEQDVEDFSADRPEAASLLGCGRAEPLANFFGSGLTGLGDSPTLGRGATTYNSSYSNMSVFDAPFRERVTR